MSIEDGIMNAAAIAQVEADRKVVDDYFGDDEDFFVVPAAVYDKDGNQVYDKDGKAVFRALPKHDPRHLHVVATQIRRAQGESSWLTSSL